MTIETTKDSVFKHITHYFNYSKQEFPESVTINCNIMWVQTSNRMWWRFQYCL